MLTFKRLLAAGIVLSATLPLQPVWPQEQDSPKEQVFELSPFEVSTDSDIGYYATSSMAGTRLNTQLRDIASSVQVVTQEFMQDVGATDLDSLMQYTTSSETAGNQGNYVGFNASAESTSSASARENIGMTQRVRGLGNPDKTRDFYKTLIPFDSYNSDRVDINRGANSFLFGLGSPAGLVNANLKRAEFRDLSEISFRIGEGGDSPSKRLELDVNRVLADDVLAVRFAALHDDKNFRQRPTYLKDQRLYGTITYKPLKDTTLRARFENGRQTANPTDVLLPMENLSMFLDAPDGLAQLSIDVVDNVRTYGNSEGPLEFRAGDRLRNFHAEPQTFFFVWDGLAENSNNAPAYARSNGIRGAAFPAAPAYFNTNGTSRKPTVYYVKHGNFQDYLPGEGTGWIQRGFVNLDTFDFSKYNLAGDNDFVQRDFKNYNLSLEQLLWNGKAGFEIAFDRQEYESKSYVLFQAGAEHVFFDINETLLFPDPNGDGLTPMANPNYGRPAIMTQNHSPTIYNDQDSLRFSGFIKHDLRDNVDGFLGKLLGRHQLTALVDRVTNGAQSIGRRYASFTPDGTPTDLARTYTHTGLYVRQLFQLVYLGPQQLDAFTDPDFTLADFRFDPITTSIPQQDLTLPVTYWNVQSNDWDQTEVSGRWVPSRGQKLSDEKVTSYAFNTQSHLLDDLLVVNLGWRRDEVRQKLRVGVEDDDIVNELIVIDPATWNLDDTPTTVINSEIFGYGAVLNMPRKLLRLPDWFDMTLHYNESENFVPAAGLRDFYGNALPTPTGESRDYGFTLYLFDSKLVARVNWFEATLANSPDGNYTSQVNPIVVNMVNAYGNFNGDILEFDANGDRLLDEGIGDAQNRSNELLARTYAARDWLAARLDPAIFDVFRFTQNPDGSYQSEWGGSNTTDLHDNQTDGMEIEIVANPTRNWRISLSVAQYETVLTNIAPRLSEFIEAVSIPFVQQFGDMDYASPTRIVGNQTVATNINQTMFPFFAIKEAEGTRAPEQREWSWTLVSNYSFRQGPLKGFSVGGAYRWQDRYAYGYPLAELNGIVIPDITNPYMSDTEYNIDVWFGYRRKIFNKSVDWDIKLNIRNINNWNSDDVSVVQVQPDGAPARARFDPPREIFLTNTFKF